MAGAVGSMPQMAPPAALDANMTGSGLGAKASHDVEESDDAFDQYRCLPWHAINHHHHHNHNHNPISSLVGKG